MLEKTDSHICSSSYCARKLSKPQISQFALLALVALSYTCPRGIWKTQNAGTSGN